MYHGFSKYGACTISGIPTIVYWYAALIKKNLNIKNYKHLKIEKKKPLIGHIANMQHSLKRYVTRPRRNLVCTLSSYTILLLLLLLLLSLLSSSTRCVHTRILRIGGQGWVSTVQHERSGRIRLKSVEQKVVNCELNNRGMIKFCFLIHRNWVGVTGKWSCCCVIKDVTSWLSVRENEI